MDSVVPGLVITTAVPLCQRTQIYYPLALLQKKNRSLISCDFIFLQIGISVSVGDFNFIFFHKKDEDSASILNVVSR